MRRILVLYSIVATITCAFLIFKLRQKDTVSGKDNVESDKPYYLVDSNNNGLIGKQLTDFTLEDTTGQTWTLSKVNSLVKVVILFSTDDCGRCLQDYRIYNAAVTKYSENQVSVLSISSDALNKLHTFMVQKKLKYPVLYDPSSLVKSSMDIRTSPLLILTDSQDKILDVQTPGIGNSRGLFDTINKILRTNKDGTTSQKE